MNNKEWVMIFAVLTEFDFSGFPGFNHLEKEEF